MWRVFWVPKDAVRTGVRRRVLAGWEDLPTREDQAGIKAGDPIFLSPDHRVDPLLGLYVQSPAFRRYTAETKRNYATDIKLLLTFLWGRGKAWTDAAERDLEDYEHWRRFAAQNPDHIGGSKWERELATFAALYGWAVKGGYVTPNPVAMKQVRGRNGDVVTVPAARAKDARPSNVHWLTPRTWRKWIGVGLRGHGRDGVPEPGWAGRQEDRNVAFTRLLVSSGLRRAEGGSLLTFEVPPLLPGEGDGGGDTVEEGPHVLRRGGRGRGDRGVRRLVSGARGAERAAEGALRAAAGAAGGHRGHPQDEARGPLAREGRDRRRAPAGQADGGRADAAVHRGPARP
jgi:hypothetical protein